MANRCPKAIDFPGVIADTPPGNKVTLKIVREKKEQTIAVKIGELADETMPNQQAEAATPNSACGFSGSRPKRRAAWA